jgi:hypothetical protein
MSYFYTDANGHRQGPVDKQQFNALAAQGIITPTTPMETEGGHTGVAGQIPGLNFNRTSVPPFAQTVSAPPPGGMYPPAGMSVATKSILLWPLDFAFRDIRIHLFILWICRIGYAISMLIAACYLLFGTLGLLAGAVGEYGSPLLILLVPLLWIAIVLGLIVTRLYFELFIVVFDWMVETTKAARLYSENNKKE